MSQGVVGANVDEMGQLAGRMHNAADQLDAIAAQLAASPRHIWHGPDAARFFGDLDDSLLPQLRVASTGLAAGATALRRNAEEQHTASSSSGSATGGWSGGGVGVRDGDGSAEAVSERDANQGSALPDSLGLAKDVVSGGEAFAQAAAADPKGISFSDFDPKNATSLLGSVFKVGGYGFAGINLAANVGAAAEGDSDAMATVTGSSGALIYGAADLAVKGSHFASVLKGVGGGLTVGADAFRMKEALEEGKGWSALYHGVHAGVAAGGIAVPPVGLGLAAWDTGVSIGTAIGNSAAANSFYDRLVAEGQSQVGGTDIATRYDGVAGAGAMARDAAVAGGKIFGQGINRLFGGK